MKEVVGGWVWEVGWKWDGRWTEEKESVCRIHLVSLKAKLNALPSFLSSSPPTISTPDVDSQTLHLSSSSLVVVVRFHLYPSALRFLPLFQSSLLLLPTTFFFFFKLTTHLQLPPFRSSSPSVSISVRTRTQIRSIHLEAQAKTCRAVDEASHLCELELSFPPSFLPPSHLPAPLSSLSL